jgi:hypothetical protein
MTFPETCAPTSTDTSALSDPDAVMRWTSPPQNLLLSGTGLRMKVPVPLHA